MAHPCSQDELPTGNADLAPTNLWILGVRSPSPLDGRVLSEALIGQKEPAAKPVQKTIEPGRDWGLYRWHQYLKFTPIGEHIYFDEGNGESVSK